MYQFESHYNNSQSQYYEYKPYYINSNSVVKNEYHKGEPYKEWFRKESSMEDWASFFRYYDLFGIWQRKEWTGKRIRYMRKLFDMVLLPKI